MNKNIELYVAENSPTQRVMIGLSWDMRDLKKLKLPVPEFVRNNDLAEVYVSGLENSIHSLRTTFFYDEHKNNKDNHNVRDMHFEQFDLDLECYIFDGDGQLIETISPDYTEMHNDGSSVFHSGEDYTGIGPFDDEDISLKMGSLPQNYEHMLFVVKSDSQFDLDQVKNPTIRIYDAFDMKETLKININDTKSENKSCYVFACLHKQDGKWIVNPINDFIDYDDNIEEYFKEMKC